MNDLSLFRLTSISEDLVNYVNDKRIEESKFATVKLTIGVKDFEFKLDSSKVRDFVISFNKDNLSNSNISVSIENFDI